MSLKNKIQPINGNHSIREAVISLFLANPILKPSRFRQLLEGSYGDVFQEFELMTQLEVQIQKHNDGKNAPVFRHDPEAGFKFSNFDKGKPSRVLQGVNEYGRTFVSYHNLNYERWKPFYEDYKSQIVDLSSVQSDLFINAFSLHYIDELLWIDSDSEIDLELILKKDHKKIPLDLFQSSNPIFNLTAEKVINEVTYYDRLEIQVRSNIQPTVVISHNVTEALQDEVQLSDLFGTTSFENKLEDMHNYNKNLLGDILTDPIQRLIGLI